MVPSLTPAPIGLFDPAHGRDSCGVGLVANVRGEADHGVVADALRALGRMAHRSACGSDEATGDGAGILVGLPHRFLREVARWDVGTELPPPGRYAVGSVFLPRDREGREACRSILHRHLARGGRRLLGWRRVPTHNASLGPGARASEPVAEQVFVEASGGMSQETFERQLFLARKQAYHEVRRAAPPEAGELYTVCSLSTRVLVYKGQLTPAQLPGYYPDLQDPSFQSHMALVHARFSTNTFPSWPRAQPMRLMCHNGEINTLRGNINWMRARRGLLRSRRFGEELERAYPIVDRESSDSGIFDNVLELLVRAGRSLPEALMMMVPEAWENDPSMSDERRAFYEYHACLMEPWDGPAAVLFGDGKQAGAVLDRNGLRPCRFWVTEEDRVILSSEVGVVDVPPSRVVAKGRLGPGRMFLVDFEEGLIVGDDAIKDAVAGARPYRAWVERQRMELEDVAPPNARLRDPQRRVPGSDHPRPEAPGSEDPERLVPRLRMFGYTTEHLDFLLRPMVEDGGDPTGSMGNDTPLAFLSDRPRLLYDYFKQLFAQVTNPPIDSIRETAVMSLAAPVGPGGNLLESSERQARRLWIPHPVLTDAEMEALKGMGHRGWRCRTIDITHPREAGADGLSKALDRICREASGAIAQGYQMMVLSDAAAGPDRVPMSALLAVGAVHHHLVRRAERTRIGLALETGEPREVHHFCALLGYGADAVNPYMAFEALEGLRRDGVLTGAWTREEIVARYREAAGKGILKVMAKMGISTVASYKGAQIFEAVGLGPGVVERCFAGTESRIGGVELRQLGCEALRRHRKAWARTPGEGAPQLPNPGEYHWRPGGERRMWNPTTLAALQHSARQESPEGYRDFARAANEDSEARSTIRGLLAFREGSPVPLEEVEPAAEIVKRFTTGAMSFGALSREAHETLAVAMNRIGGKSNSGEGGEDPERYNPLPNGDSSRSAIKQVASGRFGVSIHYLTNADQLQIKIAQGAKPGEGGELPGRKVSEAIARVRNTTPGVMLISPPPHHDIYSIEDLAQLIFDLRNANPRARVSVKLVSAVGVGTVAAGVAKARADHILLSGHDGGTGASPLTSIKHAGLPWELGIAETHQTLVMNGLRERVRLEVDGQMKTGRDVVVGALLGADEFGFSTAPLITLGCIMMRKCHLNTCPVGITTQDPELRARFRGEPEHVITYLFMVAEEAREILARLGARSLGELVGRADLLQAEPARHPEGAVALDLSPVIAGFPGGSSGSLQDSRSREGPGGGTYDPLAGVLDRELIRRAAGALELGRPVEIDVPLRNVDRTVGTLLSHEVTQRYGEGGLPDGTIHVKLRGSAGQSLGAWLAEGVTLELEGDSNDYVGKGLSGGRIIVRPPSEVPFVPEENVITGNVALYGALRGQAFFRGLAGERFAVRNSGARAVVEGVGDHGCEYMTGGCVVVLGPTGRNFAAGMSGGVAYVWDPAGSLRDRCNLDLVELEGVTDPDEQRELRCLMELHLRYTGSGVARDLLVDWETTLAQVVRVIPTEYRKVSEARRRSSADAARPDRGGGAAAREQMAGPDAGEDHG